MARNYKEVNAQKVARISGIDALRSLALLSVVFFHYDQLFPFGYLGLEMFLVISGFFISRMLLNSYAEDKPLPFIPFMIHRLFKILPSYLFFLLFGNLLYWLFCRYHGINGFIPLSAILPYLLFFRNYIVSTYYWSFEHIWSLCVEVQFYIFIGLLFLLLALKINIQKNKRLLYMLLFMTIGIMIYKIYSVLYLGLPVNLNSIVYRLDAFGWGIIAALVIQFYPDMFSDKKFLNVLLLAGSLLLFVNGFLHYNYIPHNFRIHYAHFSYPPIFSLILLGVFLKDFTGMPVFRYISLYSYNWYLWHPLVYSIVRFQFENSIFAFGLYFISSLLIAVITTNYLEQPVLDLRKKIKSIDFAYRKP